MKKAATKPYQHLISIAVKVTDNVIIGQVTDLLAKLGAATTTTTAAAAVSGVIASQGFTVLACLAAFCPTAIWQYFKHKENSEQEEECRRALHAIENLCRQMAKGDATARAQLESLIERDGPSWARAPESDSAELARRLRGGVAELLDSLGLEQWFKDLATLGFVIHSDIGRLTATVEELRDSFAERDSKQLVAAEWEIIERWPWSTALNGLQFQQTRLYSSKGGVFARGKRYEVASLRGRAADEAKACLWRHADVCRRVMDHPNIASLRAFHEEAGGASMWVVEDWVSDVTLQEHLESTGPMRAEYLRSTLLGILSALRALHDQQVIRRELHPRNVLLDLATDKPVLTDFELAKLPVQGRTVAPRGDWLNDPFLAPEVRARAGDPSVAADLYSWAMVAKACASGAPPRDADSALGVRQGLPQEVLELVNKCLGMDPAARPKGVGDVIRAVERWR